MKIELKPCPFCGGKVDIDELHIKAKAISVLLSPVPYFTTITILKCKECSTTYGHKASVSSPYEDLEKWWNKRTEEI